MPIRYGFLERTPRSSLCDDDSYHSRTAFPAAHHLVRAVCFHLIDYIPMTSAFILTCFRASFTPLWIYHLFCFRFKDGAGIISRGFTTQDPRKCLKSSGHRRSPPSATTPGDARRPFHSVPVRGERGPVTCPAIPLRGLDRVGQQLSLALRDPATLQLGKDISGHTDAPPGYGHGGILYPFLGHRLSTGRQQRCSTRERNS